jgi:hypothetical protein
MKTRQHNFPNPGHEILIVFTGTIIWFFGICRGMEFTTEIPDEPIIFRGVKNGKNRPDD